MPKNSAIKHTLIIGSGPIVIGQACEFDYSGSQAARSLREEGIEVTLLNSNPATIMTDPVVADNVYLEPISIESIIKILEEQKQRGSCD
jgi:carbamoyl-phosphate synthase large subunit